LGIERGAASLDYGQWVLVVAVLHVFSAAFKTHGGEMHSPKLRLKGEAALTEALRQMKRPRDLDQVFKATFEQQTQVIRLKRRFFAFSTMWCSPHRSQCVLL
jgi:hypothetical protein